MKQLTMNEVVGIITGLHEGDKEITFIEVSGGIIVPIDADGFQFAIWLKNVMGDDFMLTAFDIIDVPIQCDEENEINDAIQQISERFHIGGALQDHLMLPLRGPMFWMRTRFYTEQEVGDDLYLMRVVAQEAMDTITDIRLETSLSTQLDES